MFSRPSPELVLSTDALSGVNINEVDFVEEFGIDDKWFPDFRATLGRNHKFRFGYPKFSYDAEATIQRTFTFEGRTFTAGTPASTDIEWDLWKFGYEWDFIRGSGEFTGLKVGSAISTRRSPTSTSTPR